MRLTYRDKVRNMEVLVSNPNEAMTRYMAEQFRVAYEQGFREFLNDVEHAVRKVCVGKTIVIKAHPLIAHVSRDAEKKSLKEVAHA